MKKLFFLFAFMGLLAFTADAQKKSCCAAKGASADKVSCMVSTSADAEKAASEDASIVKQVSNTGEVSWTRKEVSPTTGKVSFTSVEYCTKSGKFMNVSPSEKAACTKNASATKASSSEKKAGCCAKKGEKTSTTSTSTDAKVKLVNDKGGSN